MYCFYKYVILGRINEIVVEYRPSIFGNGNLVHQMKVLETNVMMGIL